MNIHIISKVIILSVSVTFSASTLSASLVNPVYSSQDKINEARQSYNQGNYEAALSVWNKILDKFKVTGNKSGQAEIMQYKSDAYLATGQNYKAIKTLKSALNLATSTNNRLLVNRIAGSLGVAYMLSNRNDEAYDLLRKTIKEEQNDGNVNYAAIATNNLGNLLASDDKFPEAALSFEQVIKDASTIGNDVLATKAMVNLARATISQGNKKKSILQLRHTMLNAIDLPPSHIKSYILISISRLYSKLINTYDKPPKTLTDLASETLNLAAYSAQYHGDKRAMSYAYGYLGELREASGKNTDAMLYTEKALDSIKHIQAPDIKYRWQWLQGRLLKKKGETAQAIKAYQRAVNSLQKVRHIIASNKTRNKGEFRNTSGKLYMELADMLLKQTEKVKDKNKNEKTLRQVRETVEMLKNAELENYFHDDCVAALKKKIKGIDNIGEKTAAIYPVIFPDRLEILLSLPKGIKRYTVAINNDELNSEINRFREKLEKRTTHQYKRHAKKIYNWLIQPLLADLESQNVNTLIFIPDGSLRTIPITALYDGKNFLIQKYAVATTPSLTLTHPQPLPRDNMKILIAGLTDSVQGFPALPNVASEVTKLNKLYDASLLSNTSFTKTNFADELESDPYSIIHIASHGKFKSDVRNTFLLTYDSKINMDTLETYIASTKYRKRPVELLTLSACQTAVGDEKAALGLGGIAVKAGARSALATLWYINDQASSLIIKEFYAKLKQSNISKAKALQTAQLSLINDQRFKHPSYWAPFILIGNWL